jgi:hypothetical protein
LRVAPSFNGIQFEPVAIRLFDVELVDLDRTPDQIARLFQSALSKSNSSDPIAGGWTFSSWVHSFHIGVPRIGLLLESRLDWIAVEHHNASHAHTHIIVRAVLDGGRILNIAGEYIARGIRHWASELVHPGPGSPE